MKRHFYVTGYVGEGAKCMLQDLEAVEEVTLLEDVLGSREMRFLYYRLDEMTDHFQKAPLLKKIFYPFFTLLQTGYDRQRENVVLFLNSGFGRELDAEVLDRLKAKEPEMKLLLYMVDPMTGFDSPEHRKVLEKMDRIYSINEADCKKYGFHYYPLVYSAQQKQEPAREESEACDLYYLGSGDDRTAYLTQISQICSKKGIRADLRVLGKESKDAGGITFHHGMLPYEENVRLLSNANCILEIMHKEFDNPTQRYSEAVVYNKKLLTNNKRTVDFDFYRPEYVQVFDRAEEIDWEFVQKREAVDYGYQGQFSPVYLIRKIGEDLDER